MQSVECEREIVNPKPQTSTLRQGPNLAGSLLQEARGQGAHLVPYEQVVEAVTHRC